MKRIHHLFVMAASATALLLASCDRTKPYTIEVPPGEAHFVGKMNQIYTVEDNPNTQYKLSLGTTNVTSSDRIITYKVKPSANLVPGTGYTIATGNTTGTVTIKAGEALADITIKAPFAPYADPARRDTLMFTLAEPSVKVAGFQDTVYLILRGQCLESNVNVAELLGDYANTTENLGGDPYGPYTTKVASAVATSPTSATIVVENIFDQGWAPITFTLDWSDPNNRTVTLENQTNIGLGSTLVGAASQYANWQIQVGPGSGAGTFSICNQTIDLNIGLGVLDPASGQGGFFNVEYTVSMNR